MSTVTGNGVRPARPALSASKAALLQKRVRGAFKALQHEPEIPVRSTPGPAPLSFAQQRLWFLHQLDPASAAYNVPTALQLTGPLDIAAFTQAIEAIHQRHAILRSIFPAVDGEAVQLVTDAKPHCRIVDLQGKPAAERDREVTRLLDREAREPFDLSHGPVVRYTIIRMAPDEHLFLLIMHHIVTDGWSVTLFFRELELLYDAIIRGLPGNLHSLPIQYSDFAAWQREAMRGETLQRELTYWKSKLAGAPPEIDLPTDHDYRGGETQGGAHPLQLSAQFNAALMAQSRVHGVTQFMMIAAALAVTLYRWTGQSDLVIGTVAAGRTRREIENLIGCFMNFLPLRLRLAGTETGAELLRTVKSAVLEAYAHQDCPFEKIVEAINPARGAHRNPLYNVALLLQNFPTGALSSDVLAARFVPIETRSPLLDLRFVVEENERGLSVICEYDAKLFDGSTIEALLAQFHEILDKLVTAPSTSMSELLPSQPLTIQATAARARREVQTLAVASTFTADPIEDSLLYWLNEVELRGKVAFAPFNQVFQQLLDPASLLNQNRNGLNIVLARLDDWIKSDAAAGEISKTTSEFCAAIKAAVARSPAPWLVCLCPGPRHASFHNHEAAVADELRRIPGVFLLDAGEVLRLYPVKEYFDLEAERLGSVPYTPQFFAALGTAIVRKFHALKRSPRKVIALDCDQTLWEGVCGEDGPRGIRLDPPRQILQEFMRRQAESGMLLCLCTKNNDADVEEVFKCRADFPLRRDHFVGARINWKPKSENLKSLARELNVGLDSFIFVDDNAVECAEVEANCPGVLTLQLPQDVADIPRFLEHVWVFDHLKVTDEDRKRVRLYEANRQREQLRAQCVTMAEFLAGLNLAVEIEPPRDDQVSRVAQLTQRTNQFNFTTRRYSEADIQQFRHTPDSIILALSVRDRFGDYGLCGLAIARFTTEAIEVDSFLLSCRVLGKGIEHRLLAHLGSLAQSRNISRVNLYFHPTPKNKPALDFLEGIAAAFRQNHGDGSVFHLPARLAASVRYEPPETEPPKPDETARATPSETATLPLTKCRDIAMRSNDPGQILEAIGAWRRSNRVPSATAASYVAPRTDIERQLCDILQQLLGLDRVGIHDDFFALGGTSLLAVRLFAHIERSLHRALPLVTLFEAPTVERLAHLLESRSAHPRHSSIVPIQTAGAKPPIILIHGAGGGVLWGYANLAAHIGTDQPLYAVEPRLSADDDSWVTVEEMAERYLAELQAFQPNGPYYLGGYCFGGYVAYEMARRLQASGLAVALVALIDSAAPNGSYDRVPWASPIFYARFARNTAYWLGDFLRLDWRDQQRFARRKLAVLQRRIFGRFLKSNSGKVDIEQYIDPIHFPDEELRLWQAHLRAGDAYHPQPYDGRVTLLRTRGQPFLCSFDPQYGWGELARGGVDVRMIPGAHEKIFVEPDVRALGAQLAACVAEAQERVGQPINTDNALARVALPTHH